MSDFGTTRPAERPAEAKGIFGGIVVSNEAICREHYRLVIRLAQFPPSVPGQFVQIGCSDIEVEPPPEREVEWDEGRSLPALRAPELAAPAALLRRPFSLGGRRDTHAGVELDIIYRVTGTGTVWLSQARSGKRVSLIGPLGRGFTLPDEEQTAVLAGGGAGIPPMLYLGAVLAGRRVVAFCGATSRDLLPVTFQSAGEEGCDPTRPAMTVAEFARHGIPAVVSTNDGSAGFRGMITEALERYLERTAGADIVLYACGPEAMLRRVAELASARGVECQVSVERAMACGMGTCQSCCIRVRKADARQPPMAGSPWAWRLACTDGPVFRAADLLW